LETLPSQLLRYTLLYATLSAQKLVNAFDTCACRASQAERTVVKMAQS